MALHFSTAIFDMDGTLLGTERLAVEALTLAFAEHDVSVPPLALEHVIGLAGNDTRAYLAQFSPAGVDAEQSLRRGSELIKARIAEHGMPVKSGVLNLLAYLHARGTALGVATSTRAATAMDHLQHAAIAHYFGTVIGGDDVENAKPHPEIYLRVLARLGASAADAIAIEDSDHGIKSAYAAGLRVIYVPDIKPLPATVRELVHREYATLDELHAELVQVS
jgi:HAD superfamily hydrolase (TIGR01509 family)